MSRRLTSSYLQQMRSLARLRQQRKQDLEQKRLQKQEIIKRVEEKNRQIELQREYDFMMKLEQEKQREERIK